MSALLPRLRIAVLSRSFSAKAGGAERYSVALVEQLAARHELHVYAQSKDEAGGGRIPGVTYHRVSMPIGKPRWINQLWFATATWWATRAGAGFDVVHSHENTWHGNVQTVHVLPVKHNLFHGRRGAKLALRWLKVVTSPRLLVYLWLEARRYAQQAGRQVVVTSDSLREIFCAAYPGARAMASVITPGIDPPAPVDEGSKQQARQQLCLPVGGFCILLVGNDLRKKGLPTLIEAFKLLRQTAGQGAPQPILAVVGGTAQLPYFRQQAAEAGLAEAVYFLGSLDDVGPAYRAADCLAHPTLEDTFAMVVLEAMAHGLPVMVSSSRYCGIAGLLADGVNALLLTDPRDAKALAAGLGHLQQTPERCRELGTAARAFATQHQWQAVALRQEQVYLRVAGQNGLLSK